MKQLAWPADFRAVMRTEARLQDVLATDQARPFSCSH